MQHEMIAWCEICSPWPVVTGPMAPWAAPPTPMSPHGRLRWLRRWADTTGGSAPAAAPPTCCSAQVVHSGAHALVSDDVDPPDVVGPPAPRTCQVVMLSASGLRSWPVVFLRLKLAAWHYLSVSRRSISFAFGAMMTGKILEKGKAVILSVLQDHVAQRCGPHSIDRRHVAQDKNIPARIVHHSRRCFRVSSWCRSGASRQ